MAAAGLAFVPAFGLADPVVTRAAADPAAVIQVVAETVVPVAAVVAQVEVVVIQAAADLAAVAIPVVAGILVVEDLASQ
jgi:hypothetical protein